MINLNFFPSKPLAFYMARLFIVRSLAVLVGLTVVLMMLDLLGNAGEILAVPGNGDAELWRFWEAQGFIFWVKAGPSGDSIVPAPAELGRLVEASRIVPPPPSDDIVPGAPACRPASPLDPARTGLPEVLGTSGRGSLWALLFPPRPAKLASRSTAILTGAVGRPRAGGGPAVEWRSRTLAGIPAGLKRRGRRAAAGGHGGRLHGSGVPAPCLASLDGAKLREVAR